MDVHIVFVQQNEIWKSIWQNVGFEYIMSHTYKLNFSPIWTICYN